MQIQEIKTKLPLSQVLTHYHLKPDKQNRLNCPFHNDKTPSMQVYPKTNTVYCFSANCKTHGKSLDVIDFIMYKERCTKREAILKAVEMINGTSATSLTTNTITTLTRTAVLTKVFTYFKNGVHNSMPARTYLEKRGLDNTKTEVGYNSGQFHHVRKKEVALIESCIKYGVLLDLDTKSRMGNPSYKSFGKCGVVFALRNERGNIVSLYFRSILDKKNGRHFYLRDRQGLYPGYPESSAERLIITESIIDAATLLEQQSIKSQYEVLALFGTNGLTAEHEKAIKELKQLKEIIFFLNGDEAGEKAVEKYASMLKGEYESMKISKVEVPENEDVNSLLIGHSPDILLHLIETRKDCNTYFSIENKSEEMNEEATAAIETKPVKKPKQKGLDCSNPYNLKYEGKEAKYQIKGFKITQPDSLKITLNIMIA